MRVLDVGCSKNKIKGAIGLDINKESDADIICDLDKTLPIKESSIDRVYCKHLLEHLKDPESVVREIYRISRDGAMVTFEVPHFSSHIAYSDLTHKRYFSYVLLNKLVNIVRHKTVKKEITLYKSFRVCGIKFLANRFKESYERFWTYIFPAENLKFEIEIDKSKK